MYFLIQIKSNSISLLVSFWHVLRATNFALTCTKVAHLSQTSGKGVGF